MARFIKGLELCRLFYQKAVRPILSEQFPRLRYSAARLGRGSEVLGFDNTRSTDHDWGPKLTLFLDPRDIGPYRKKILKSMEDYLPFEILGYPTHYQKNDDWTYRLEKNRKRPIHHQVSVTTIGDFYRSHLGFDPSKPGHPNDLDWLLTPQQLLRSVTSGQVFHDGLKKLIPVRKKLTWYPKDLWIYQLACQWKRISQEEPFMARCGESGDDLGSRLIAARIIGDLMDLCFLMERTYAPYSKWFGTAFSKLPAAKRLLPLFGRVLKSKDWKTREKNLTAAYKTVIQIHNSLRLTKKIPPKISNFHSRPYQVPHSDRIVEALLNRISSVKLSRLASRLKAGSINQFINSTEILDDDRKKTWKLLKSVFGDYV